MNVRQNQWFFFVLATATTLIIAALSIGFPRALFWMSFATFTGVCVGILVGVFRGVRGSIVRAVKGGILGAILGATVAFHVFGYRHGPYGRYEHVVWFAMLGGFPGALLASFAPWRKNPNRNESGTDTHK